MAPYHHCECLGPVPPPPDGIPIILLSDGSHLWASVVGLRREELVERGPSLVHFDSSTVEALGIKIGFDHLQPDDHCELRLTGGSAGLVSQFLQVGTEGSARLVVDESSQVNADEAYLNIGDHGWGDLHLSGASTLIADALNVGLHDLGNVRIDENSSLLSVHGNLGELHEGEGTVNLESGGIWETEELVVGVHGRGYV